MLLGMKGLGKEEALQEIQDFKQRHAATNCAELLAKENIDGGLIGGASLVAEKFGVLLTEASK